MARVIRQKNARVIKTGFLEAKQTAEQLIEDAKAQAARIIEDAEQSSVALREETMESARGTAAAECAEMILSANEHRRHAIEESTDEIQTLALSVAKHLFKEELTLSPEKIRAICANAVQRVKRARQLIIRVHPDDLVLLQETDWECIADPSLSRGDCIIKSDLGVVDATVETRLSAVQAAWKKKRNV